MQESPYHLVVFEHETVRVDRRNGRGKILEKECYKSLCSYHGEKGVPYFSLINNGVRFCEYVGVLQIGKYQIEILPKADKGSGIGEENKWQKTLIKMLKESGQFPVDAPSSSNLNLKKHSILDLYIQLFIREIRELVHQGLIKKYCKVEENLNALKGRLLFNCQLQKNLVHAEKFYTSNTTYNRDNIYNQILFKTLRLIVSIASSPNIAEAKNLQLYFPELPDVDVSEATFNKIKHDRKSERYKQALQISRLLLLNFHPNLNTGKNYVLALMFDMNLLWERYILNRLKKAARDFPDLVVSGQESRQFWNGRTIRPDIVVRSKHNVLVIDTKWKAIQEARPSIEDVRQMYVYNNHFKSSTSILLYPDVFGVNSFNAKYHLSNLHLATDKKDHACSVQFITVDDNHRYINQLLTKFLLSGKH